MQWPHVGTAQEKGEQRERDLFAAVREVLCMAPEQFQVPPVA